MEKELKIAELAGLWNVSVPTCWNRIKKEGLTTFKKKDETNKDISYVKVTDDIINKYVINEVNNINNNVNNGYYEELLTDNKVNNNINNAENINITANIIQDLINYNKVNNEELKTVYNDYNNRIERLQEELITYKSKVPLLEDRANREGLYLKEIEDLKKQNKTDKTLIKLLITLLTIVIMFILMLITYFITVNNLTNTETEKPSIEEVSMVENVNN